MANQQAEIIIIYFFESITIRSQTNSTAGIIRKLLYNFELRISSQAIPIKSAIDKNSFSCNPLLYLLYKYTTMLVSHTLIQNKDNLSKMSSDNLHYLYYSLIVILVLFTCHPSRNSLGLLEPWVVCVVQRTTLAKKWGHVGGLGVSLAPVLRFIH